MSERSSVSCGATWIFVFLIFSLTIFASVARALVIPVSWWTLTGRHWTMGYSFRRRFSVTIITWISTTVAVFGILSIDERKLERLKSVLISDLFFSLAFLWLNLGFIEKVKELTNLHFFWRWVVWIKKIRVISMKQVSISALIADSL